MTPRHQEWSAVRDRLVEEAQARHEAARGPEQLSQCPT
jgi:hypothetical protein